MFSCRVDLLGQPGFWRADSTFAPLERRLALALAYLALEGPTCRAELAALLWPESGERQRNDSLRQLLFKLRRRLGAGVLVERARVLSLSDALTVDAVRVRAASRGRHWADVVAARPHLLEGVREDGDSELGTWLARQRAGFVFRHAAALGQEAARLDEEGQPAEAVKLASARLQLDPYSDEACCQVLGLLLRLGDRIGALQVCEDYCLKLRYALGEEPSQQLKDLLKALQGRAPDDPIDDHFRRVPLYCPVLVGREAALRQLREAWEQRIPIIYVCASAGVGKSRLMTEFVHRQVQHLSFRDAALPGDAEIRFGSKIHTVRKILRDFPTIELELEPWVRRQLGRIVPELSAGAEGLGRPEPSEPEFVEANRWLYQALGRHVSAIIFDDGQFLDDDTIILGLALEARVADRVEAGDFPVILVGLRPGQLPPAKEQTLRERAAMGQAAWIDLDLLAPEAIREMVSGFGIPGLERYAGDVVALSGGSPWVVQELAKLAADSAGPDGALPADFEPARCARALFAREVKQLSAEALRVARAIALVGEGASTALLAAAADVSFGQLAGCLRELDRRHLFQGGAFTSPAVPVVLREGMSEAVRLALAQRIGDAR